MSAIICFKCKKLMKSGLITSPQELETCCLCDDKEISQAVKEIGVVINNEEETKNIIEALKEGITSQYCYVISSIKKELKEFNISNEQYKQLFDSCFLESKEKLDI